jgi:hypothetical protein
MTKECLEITGSVANFTGGIVLLVDTLRIRNNIETKSVSQEFLDAMNEIGSADRLETSKRKSLATPEAVEEWLSRWSLKRAWIGFALMIAGFGCEIASHFFS